MNPFDANSHAVRHLAAVRIKIDCFFFCVQDSLQLSVLDGDLFQQCAQFMHSTNEEVRSIEFQQISAASKNGTFTIALTFVLFSRRNSHSTAKWMKNQNWKTSARTAMGLESLAKTRLRQEKRRQLLATRTRQSLNRVQQPTRTRHLAPQCRLARLRPCWQPRPWRSKRVDQRRSASRAASAVRADQPAAAHDLSAKRTILSTRCASTKSISATQKGSAFNRTRSELQ